MLVVTAAAADPTLLTLAEIAEAIRKPLATPGLAQLNASVGDLLAAACGLERAGASRLTLRLETLTDTQRLSCDEKVLRLPRKPVIEVLSLSENGTEIFEDYDFEQSDDRSLIRLASDGTPTCWSSGKIVTSFRAGWQTVPPGLKELACKLALLLYSERIHDPSLGSMAIPDVISETYRFARPDDPLIPAEIMEGLKAGGYLMHEMVY